LQKKQRFAVYGQILFFNSLKIYKAFFGVGFDQPDAGLVADVETHFAFDNATFERWL
jgi:hypothetical protein